MKSLGIESQQPCELERRSCPAEPSLQTSALAMTCIYIPDAETLWVMCVWPEPLRYVVICYAIQISNIPGSKSVMSWKSWNRINPHSWKPGKISINSVVQLVISYHGQLLSLCKHTMVIWGVMIERWVAYETLCTTFKIYVNLVLFQHNLVCFKVLLWYNPPFQIHKCNPRLHELNGNVEQEYQSSFHGYLPETQVHLLRKILLSSRNSLLFFPPYTALIIIFLFVIYHIFKNKFLCLKSRKTHFPTLFGRLSEWSYYSLLGRHGFWLLKGMCISHLSITVTRHLR